MSVKGSIPITFFSKMVRHQSASCLFKSTETVLSLSNWLASFSALHVYVYVHSSHDRNMQQNPNKDYYSTNYVKRGIKRTVG
jgi:hypothetical protein